jgi:CHRD domain
VLQRLVIGLVLLGAVGALLADQSAGGEEEGFRASLNGDKELGEGDGNGRGTFTARFDGRQLCYTLRFSGLDDPQAAHIHRGSSRRNGAIVIDLQPRFTDSGARNRCVTVSSSDLRRSIRNRPSNFYVNVHTERYPDGAIRGQLTER